MEAADAREEARARGVDEREILMSVMPMGDSEGQADVSVWEGPGWELARPVVLCLAVVVVVCCFGRSASYMHQLSVPVVFCLMLTGRRRMMRARRMRRRRK